MEVREAILKRRSQRRFTDEPVTEDEVRELLEAARWAPSWANTQVWHFITVRDRERIRQIVSTYTEKNPATKCSLDAPVLLVACAQTGVSGGGKGSTMFSEWFMFDLGCAVENLCLRAHDLGLGTVIVGSLDHQACKKILRVPDGFEVVAVIPVGRPAVPDKQGPPRKELREFAHRETWEVPYEQ